VEQFALFRAEIRFAAAPGSIICRTVHKFRFAIRANPRGRPGLTL